MGAKFSFDCSCPWQIFLFESLVLYWCNVSTNWANSVKTDGKITKCKQKLKILNSINSDCFLDLLKTTKDSKFWNKTYIISLKGSCNSLFASPDKGQQRTILLIRLRHYSMLKWNKKRSQIWFSVKITTTRMQIARVILVYGFAEHLLPSNS